MNDFLFKYKNYQSEFELIIQNDGTISYLEILYEIEDSRKKKLERKVEKLSDIVVKKLKELIEERKETKRTKTNYSKR